MTENAVLQAAFRLIDEGIAVFPTQGKRPVTASGFQDATLSKEFARAWWEENPEWNLAARIPDDVVVVDVDGALGYEELRLHGFDLPDTARTRTRKGAHHWYLLDPERGGKVERKIRVLPTVDLLANGFAMMAPSKHPLGGSYVEELAITRANMEMAPAWIYTAASSDKAKQALLTEQAFISGLPDGQRQNGLFLWALNLGRKGNSIFVTKAAIRELAAQCGSSDYDTDKLVERVYKKYIKPEEQEVPAEPEVVSLADMAGMTLSPPEYLIGRADVDAVLPIHGYTILQGDPKRGKSLLAAEMSLALATGQPFLGRQTTQVGVLYLDLENDQANAFSRWTKIMRGMGISSYPANLFSSYGWPSVDEGGLDRIGEFVVNHSGTGVVVIDSFYCLRGQETGNGSVWDQEAKVMRRLYKLSNDYGVSVVILLHTAKSQAYKSAVQRTSGTFGMSAPAGTIWDLRRDEGRQDAKLVVTGRNVQEVVMDIFLGPDLTWRLS